ncbi:MAG: DMSO reductase [Proteobacteria bacterium]|nr:MAG: DMSO reductase [Pseudomonadota bacterium]QKK11551.1 MAG: dimethyl sulfoxide reductase anchor subunit [Pseudomonadota bacterium]
MHPAFSVIFLTTLIGVGQGLFLALYTGQLYSLANLLPPQDSRSFYAFGGVIAVAFLIGGLIASFFHLGRPERAWRSASQWRTSWLSREVIVLPITVVSIALYSGLHFIGWTGPWFTVAGVLPVDATLVAGGLAMIAVLLLFVCTAMIYACLKFLQEWHSWLTVVNYLLLGSASGFMLAAAFSAWQGVGLVGFYGAWAAILTLAAFVTRGASLLRNRRLRHKSNLQTAIGVRHNHIVQMAQGATGGSFNTREFFHRRPRQVTRGIRIAFLVLVFPVPVVLLLLAYLTSSATLPVLAFVLQYLGLIAERWYFFAEARHPQNLYYQYVS